mgnify:CR=1 FL=1
MFENYKKSIAHKLDLEELLDLMQTNYSYPLQLCIYNMCVFINSNRIFSIFLLYTFIFFLYLCRF